MQIVVFGSGSIGCYIGGRLAQNPFNSTTFIGRDRIFQEIFNNNGLTLSDLKGNFQHIELKKLNLKRDFEALKEIENAVTVKSKDTEFVAEFLSKLKLKEESWIISFQNGIGNAKILQDHLLNHRIISGMISFNVLRMSN